MAESSAKLSAVEESALAQFLYGSPKASGFALQPHCCIVKPHDAAQDRRQSRLGSSVGRAVD